ncbi:TIM barrel protein [Roseobacter sinensis]|uniref:TIM barrel protein n=1 Tax=Roseobacter sinensis TaxID=2931391 RepID=A0ABT3B962_9RHOB|nr:TIM barrel protein [Roseobacter sp. WL0113]MCV3270118.1 TIM barrel protein [Roseobacter sp. WL0113]
MKFAANLSLLWPELPYLDRFDAAAEAGFDGVEVMFPYEMPAKDTQRALMRAGIQMVLIAAPPPNYTGGARGFAAVPEAAERFRYDLRRAMRYCMALRAPVLQLLAGAAEGDAARRTLVENLAFAASEAPEGLLVTISPVSVADLPGSFLSCYDLAAEILEEVNAPNVGLQFDSCQAEVMHGDPVRVLETHAALIRHVQVSDPPDGAADLDALATGLMDIDYGSWVSVGYDPSAPPETHREACQRLRR